MSLSCHILLQRLRDPSVDVALALSLVLEAREKGNDLGRVCSAPEREDSFEDELTSSRYCLESPAWKQPYQGPLWQSRQELSHGEKLPIVRSFICDIA